MKDGSLKTYQYHNNMVDLMAWLNENRPQDTDNLTNINHAELRDGFNDPEIITIAGPNNVMDSGLLDDFEQDTQSLAVADGTYQDNAQFQYASPNNPPHFSQDLAFNGAMMPEFHQSSPPAFNQLTNHQTFRPFFPENTIQQNFSPPFSLQTQDTNMSTPFPYSIHNPAQDQSQMNPEYQSSSPYRPVARTIQSSPARLQQAPTRSLTVSSPLSHQYGPRSGQGRIHLIKKLEQWGDLTTWTPEELADNRRIVRFHKAERGDVIILDSGPLAAEDYKEDMINILCIRWAPAPPNEIQHRLAGQCVFTSVDIIGLMERIVDYSFMVQEKNRIRRNLEGFKPETVRKEGSSGRFFNQVMNYVQPKARNIEKDIKVFMWTD